MTSGTANIKSSFRNEEARLSTSYVHFSRILVGTDFSKPVAQALKLAIAIAEDFNSEIFIVHAVTPLIYGDGQEPISAAIMSAQLEAAKYRMQELVTSEPRLAELRLETTVAHGGVIDLITQVLIDEKSALVVLGSHRASGLEGVMLGSAAENVLRKSYCPVLIVGPNFNVGQHPFRSILLATDLDTTGLRAPHYASALSDTSMGSSHCCM